MARAAKKDKQASEPRRSATALPRRTHREPIPRTPFAFLKWLFTRIPGNAAALLAVLALAAGGVFFWQFLYRSEYFLVQEWDIIGLQRLNSDLVRRTALGEEETASLLALPPSLVEERLREIPAVHHAHVRRGWPNRIDVLLQERQARAILVTSDVPLLVDAEGVLFDQASGQELLLSGLPLFTGPTDRAYRLGERLEPQFVEAAFAYTGALETVSGVLQNQLAEVHWEPDTGVTLYLKNGTRLLCGDRPVGETLALAEALAEQRKSLDGVEMADLRIGSHVAWRPVPPPPQPGKARQVRR